MSLTHFSSNHLLETLWYPYPIMDYSPKSPNDHHHQPPPSAFNFNINTTHYVDDHNNQQQQQQDDIKEPMFEKPLTPSDVGKLNRLVIPKQHAEKYFPLGGGDSVAVDQQKGLLLSFEDETGKPWRLVKEKRLDAGDVVLFERHRFDCDRLFIGWRRRPVTAPMLDSVAVAYPAGGGGWTSRGIYDGGWNDRKLEAIEVGVMGGWNEIRAQMREKELLREKNVSCELRGFQSF